MLQRIQTIYLLIIVILSGITLFVPNAHFIASSDNVDYVFNLRGLYSVTENAEMLLQDVWTLTAIKALIALIALYTIFIYKKRILQIRLSIFNMVLMLGYYPILFIYLWLIKSNLKIEYVIGFVTVFQVINIILSVLAIRAIGKDEALVKSLNRLR